MITKKKKPKENDDEINICEVKCQTHGDDTDSVTTLIESCQTHGDDTDSVTTLIESCDTEPSCSSSTTDSTNKVKNLDENHSTLLSRIWESLVHLSMSKVFPGYIIVVLNHIRLFV